MKMIRPGIIECLVFLALVFAAPGAFGSVYVVDQRSPAADDGNSGTPEKPLKTITAAVKKLQPGDTVTVKAGVYREEVAVNVSGTAEKPIVVEAAKGETVVITGADLVAGWVSASAKGARNKDLPLWKKSPWKAWAKYGTETEGRGPGPMLVVDGVIYRHVKGIDGAFPGSYFYDPEGEGAIYLWLIPARTGQYKIAQGAQWWDNPADLTSEDPNRHQVEAAVRPTVLGVSGGQSYVTLRGFTIRYTTAGAQGPALYIESDFNKGVISRHCVLEDCVVEYCHGRGVTCQGANLTVRRCTMRFNGASGAGGCMVDGLWEDNVLEGNTRMGHSHSWEAGGVKFVRSTRLTIRGCRFVNNDGPGLWFDWGNSGIVVERCFASYNSGSGIMVEVSPRFESEKPDAKAVVDEQTARFAGMKTTDAALPIVLRNNICVGNKWDGTCGAGILLQLGSNVSVVNNTVVGNAQYGIFVRYHPYDTDGHRCVDNLLLNNLCADNGGSQIYITPDPADKPGYVARNRSDYNLFWDTKAWLNKNESTQTKDYGWDRAVFSRWGKTQGDGTYSVEEWFKIRGFDEHSIQWEPMFVSPEILDFSLQQCSPAIGAGEPTEHAAIDYYGRKRPDGRPPSIGAVEYFPVVPGTAEPQLGQ